MEHLAGGLTTVCRCWRLRRRDGLVLGFTDHDGSLRFDGLVFRPEAGLAAGALVQGTGLAVDNGEALGALSDEAITATDLDAGRWDGAEVKVWAVNWADVAARQVIFAGTLGEVRQGAGAFRAELRGLTAALNRPGGRTYLRHCAAVLGDRACRFDLTKPGYRVEWVAEEVDRGQRLYFRQGAGVQARWFERGRVEVLSGPAAGLEGVIKHDQTDAAGRRVIELWEPIRGGLAAGARIRIEAGCDKRTETCRTKFANVVNYHGFPFVPGEDWLTAIPATQPGTTAE